MINFWTDIKLIIDCCIYHMTLCVCVGGGGGRQACHEISNKQINLYSIMRSQQNFFQYSLRVCQIGTFVFLHFKIRILFCAKDSLC